MKPPLLLLLFIFSCLSPIVGQSTIEADSLNVLISKEKDPCEKLRLQGELALIFSASNQIDTFSILIDPLLKHPSCKEITEPYILRYRADTFFVWHYNLDSAIHYTNLSWQHDNLSPHLSKQLRFRKGYFNSLNGKFNDVVEYFPSIIEEEVASGNFPICEFMIRIHLNALHSTSQFGTLEAEAQKYLSYGLGEKTDLLKAICYYYLASSSFDGRLIERTKEYNEKAYFFAQKAQEPHSLMGILALKQQLLMEEHRYKDAYKTLIELDSLSAIFGIRQELYQLTNWASYYQKTNQLDSAIERCRFIIDYPEASIKIYQSAADD